MLWKVGTPTAGTAEVGVFVGDVVAGDSNVVCLETPSKSGTTFAIADVAVGANAGTYYAKAACSTTVATVSGGGAWKSTGW